MLAPNPVALNDAQLAAVMTAASNLSVDKRDAFLERVAAGLSQSSRFTAADFDHAVRAALRGLPAPAQRWPLVRRTVERLSASTRYPSATQPGFPGSAVAHRRCNQHGKKENAVCENR